MASPTAIVVPALKRHTASVIVAHGLGDSGAGWSFLAENFRRRNKFEEVSFIFPHAPKIPITVNFGMTMPGWYDITSFSDDISRHEDEVGILRSRDIFHALIKAEIDKGIPSHRVVLGGFSQGGAVSVMAGVTCPQKLGGIFGLSCYMLLSSKLRSLIPNDNPNKDTPIFMGHGDQDPLVKYEWGMKTAEALRDWGWNVDFRTYKGVLHSVDMDEIDDLEEYLSKRIPPIDNEGTGTS